MKHENAQTFRTQKTARQHGAARRLRAATEMDYEEMAEPNMKLSRALLIVLVLHVVAVSGIIAFNAIKTRQDSFAKPAIGGKLFGQTSAKRRLAGAHRTERRRSGARTREHQPTLAKARPVTHPLPIEQAAKPADSGKIYVVVKGDNPVTIAKKLKVSYDNLIELNHIDDPRKLQIGQKLMIPTSQLKAKENRRMNESGTGRMPRRQRRNHASEERIYFISGGPGVARHRHRDAFQHQRLCPRQRMATLGSSSNVRRFWLGIGLVACTLAALVDYHFWQRTWWIWFASL